MARELIGMQSGAPPGGYRLVSAKYVMSVVSVT